jgi:hypothetical protein
VDWKRWQRHLVRRNDPKCNSNNNLIWFGLSLCVCLLWGGWKLSPDLHFTAIYVFSFVISKTNSFKTCVIYLYIYVNEPLSILNCLEKYKFKYLFLKNITSQVSRFLLLLL